MMKVVFRADSSYSIGTGHIMRCLALADALREKGADVSFISRELPGHLCDFIESKNYRLHRLPFESTQKSQINNYNHKHVQTTSHLDWLGVGLELDLKQCWQVLKQKYGTVDWLVVDHYALDATWELPMRQLARKIMVIDDLADRVHGCDLLLDQNLYQNLHTRYDGLVPKSCIKLLGPSYALLRQEFLAARQSLRNRDGIVKRILIFFGGSDSTNETVKALTAIKQLGRPDINVDVVVGASNPNQKQIKAICKAMPNTNYYCQINNMAQLMAKADLAIGAGGSTTWERCYLGLPTITLIVAKNQLDTTNAVAALGALYNLGWMKSVTVEKLAKTLNWVISNPEDTKKIGQAALQIMAKTTLDKEYNVVKVILEANNGVV